MILLIVDFMRGDVIFMLKEKKWGKETIRCIVVMMMSFVLLGFTSGTSSAAIRKEVISSTAKLPESMQFNVIAEPFAWGKDVTRVMLNAGEEFNSSDLAVADFNVTGNHYSAQAQKFAFQGPRKVLDVYPRSEERRVGKEC